MAKSVQAQQAGVLLLGRILATLAEAVAPFVLVRLLEKTAVGVLTEVLLIYTMISMFLTFGLPITLSFHLPGLSVGERRQIAWRVGRLLLLLGALGGVIQVGAGLWGLRGGEVGVLGYLAALALLPLGDVPMRLLPNLLVVEGWSRAAAGIGILRSLGLSLGILVPVALGLDLWVVMGCLSVVGLLFAGATTAFLLAVYRGVEPGDTPVASSWELFRFGLPLSVNELVVNLNSRFDRILIALLFVEATYAEYQAGSWQIPLIPGIVFAVATAYGPYFSELFKKGEAGRAVEVWREQARKTALLVVPIAAVFIVAAEETIEVLFTAEYLRGAFVFRCYSLITLGRITGFGTLLVSAGRPDYVVRAAAIALGANILLSVPLVLWLGFDGPAIGTVLAFIPMVMAYNYYISRSSGVPYDRVFPLLGYLKVVAVAAAAGALAVAAKLTLALSAGVMLLIEAAIVLLAFAVIGTLAGLIEPDDWRFVRDWVWMKALRRRTEASTIARTQDS